jgi:hypothetical protein
MRRRDSVQPRLHQLRYVALADAFAMERRAIVGGMLATPRLRLVDPS